MTKWIDDWFGAQQVTQGGLIRRHREYVDKYSSIDEVTSEAKRRGFHVFESGNQVFVICNDGHFKVHC